MITAVTPYDDWPHKDTLSESLQRVARSPLGLLLVGGPLVAALLFFFWTRCVPTGTGIPAAPATTVEPKAAPTPRPVLSSRTTPPAPTEPVSQAPLTIVLRPPEECWVSLRIDDEPVLERIMRPGERASYEADAEILLTVGHAGGFAYTINQRVGRSLGASGEVVTERITLQNYRSYVVP